MTPARYQPAAGPTEAPVRYSTVVAILIVGGAGLVLLTGAGLWVSAGVLAGRAAAEKPPIANCASPGIQPHYEASR